MRRRLTPVAATATTGGIHHDATPTACSTQVTNNAAATAAATVQSSPMMNPYQNVTKARSQRMRTGLARCGEERNVVHLALSGPRCRRSHVMYQADARKYQAARAMMDRSEPGHAIPIPSTAQNVPNADNSVPTTSCKALRGMRSTARRASAPAPPMTTSATAAARAALGNARAAAPNVTTIIVTSRPSSTTPRNDNRKAIQFHTVGGDVVVGRSPGAHAAQATDADAAISLPEPLKTEHEQQRADENAQQSDGDECQGCAEPQDKRRQNDQASSSSEQGRPPASHRTDGDDGDHHFGDLYSRGEERGGEDRCVDHGKAIQGRTNDLSRDPVSMDPDCTSRVATNAPKAPRLA